MLDPDLCIPSFKENSLEEEQVDRTDCTVLEAFRSALREVAQKINPNSEQLNFDNSSSQKRIADRSLLTELVILFANSLPIQFSQERALLEFYNILFGIPNIRFNELNNLIICNLYDKIEKSSDRWKIMGKSQERTRKRKLAEFFNNYLILQNSSTKISQENSILKLEKKLDDSVMGEVMSEHTIMTTEGPNPKSQSANEINRFIQDNYRKYKEGSFKIYLRLPCFLECDNPTIRQRSHFPPPIQSLGYAD